MAKPSEPVLSETYVETSVTPRGVEIEVVGPRLSPEAKGRLAATLIEALEPEGADAFDDLPDFWKLHDPEKFYA